MRDPVFVAFHNQLRRFAKGHFDEKKLLEAARRLELAAEASAFRPRDIPLAKRFSQAYQDARRIFVEAGGKL